MISSFLPPACRHAVRERRSWPARGAWLSNCTRPEATPEPWSPRSPPWRWRLAPRRRLHSTPSRISRARRQLPANSNYTARRMRHLLAVRRKRLGSRTPKAPPAVSPRKAVRLRIRQDGDRLTRLIWESVLTTTAPSTSVTSTRSGNVCDRPAGYRPAELAAQFDQPLIHIEHDMWQPEQPSSQTVARF